MKAYQYLLIAIVLVGLAVAPLIVVVPVDWNAFWTNVSTELIGAAVAVVLFGYIVTRMEDQRDKKEKKAIERSLGELAFEFANQVSELLGIRELPAAKKALKDKKISGIAEHTIGMMPTEIASAVRSLRDPKLVSLAEYVGSIERFWQAFYNQHSNRLARELSAEILRLSKAFEALRGNVLALSQVEAEAERNFQGDWNDELNVFSHRSQIHEEQGIRSTMLAYDLLVLLMACVSLAIRTEYIVSHVWSVAKLDSLIEETDQQSEKADEEFRN